MENKMHNQHDQKDEMSKNNTNHDKMGGNPGQKPEHEKSGEGCDKMHKEEKEKSQGGCCGKESEQKR